MPVSGCAHRLRRRPSPPRALLCWCLAGGPFFCCAVSSCVGWEAGWHFCVKIKLISGIFWYNQCDREGRSGGEPHFRLRMQFIFWGGFAWLQPWSTFLLRSSRNSWQDA
ncbi:hypothetical protein SEVIR_9G316501v4 [Setaria viridis]